MEYTIHLEQQTARPLAVVRRRAAGHELSKVVPECCGIVWNALKVQKVTGAGRHVAVYLDDQINLEVGVELDTPFAGHNEVVPPGDAGRSCGLNRRKSAASSAVCSMFTSCS
jgi:hypothetical protein